jgi:glycosyltransferase involved in cell wall biosynthesis
MPSTGSSSSNANREGDQAASDLVVGVATYNHARTVRRLIETIRAALTGVDPSLRARILVVDGGSSDGTRERIQEVAAANGDLRALSYAVQPDDVLNVPYHGLPGRARALRRLLGEAHAINARACIILDALATAVAPETIGRLADPIIEQHVDLIVPSYRRHPFEGALVHGAVYPMFRALYGVRLRSPLGSDFGCSPRLMEAVLSDPIWESESGQLGIDLWIAATAVSGGFRVAQAPFGPKLMDERNELDLSTTIVQVFGFLFSDMERRGQVWHRIRGSRPIASFGNAGHTEPEQPEVEIDRLVESFRLGYRELRDVWAEVLPPLATLQWRRLAGARLEEFRVEDALWARTVYDFAMGHRLRVIARDHLLRSLAPLYLAWLASFVLELRHATPEAAEERIERLCLAFEAEKPYLISMWRWPERFRPVKIRR